MKGQFHRSPLCTRLYLLQYNLLDLLVTFIILGAFIFAAVYYHWPHFWLYLFIGLAIIDLIYRIISPISEFYFTQYRVIDERIEVKRGLWFQELDVIKIKHIQFMSRQSGPLTRRHQLSALTLFTAGNVLTLPYLKESDVTHLEDDILNVLERGDVNG
ncbi:PH domain-containing protein [Staphylococcus sp. 11261D007BR]